MQLDSRSCHEWIQIHYKFSWKIKILGEKGIIGGNNLLEKGIMKQKNGVRFKFLAWKNINLLQIF